MLEELRYDFACHVNPWTACNEKVCIKSDPVGGYPECWGGAGNIFTGNAVDSLDIKKSMGILLGNVLAGLRRAASDGIRLFEVADPQAGGVTRLFPDHVDEEFSFEGVRLEATFFAPRGFYGFLIKYRVIETEPDVRLAIVTNPNPKPFATARSPHLRDYYWDLEGVETKVEGGAAVAYSGETAVAVGTSDQNAAVRHTRHALELDFDTAAGKVIYVAVGFAFDGADNALAEVNRLLADSDGHFQSNREFWEGFFAPLPTLSNTYQKPLSWASWCSMANVIESNYIRFNPAMVHHRAGCYCRVFSWDPLFAFVGLSVTGAKDLARDLLTTYMKFNITPEGRSFMGFSLNGVCDADGEFDFGFDFEDKVERLDNDLQPLYPWVVLEMMRNIGDDGLLRRQVDDATVYEKLLLYMNHVERDQEDPTDSLLVRDNAYEGGWDNRKSPLFERGVRDKLLNVQVFYQMSLESMSEICGIMGDAELAGKFSLKAEVVRKNIGAGMWCEEHGCYEDIDVYGNLAHVLCLDTFLPLRFEEDAGRRARILEHLHNRDEFDLPAGLPTLAANDPDFNLDWGWRGNLWLAQVALVALCMADGGLGEEAAELMHKHLDRYDMATNVGEHQDPYTGRPNGLGAGPFNWLGLLPVAALHIRNAGGSLSRVTPA